jgi:hypothetical protein
MAKLGYTWYPKDWGNSESVFELSLSERGLYREFIDLAMLNDNKTEIKKDVWTRKFCVSKEDLESILDKLRMLNLIEFIDNILFIPSCESRLKLVRGGHNGGKKSKPIAKPIAKPFESLEEKNEKPIAKQREREREREIKKEIEIENKTIPTFIDFLNFAFTHRPNISENDLKFKYDSWIANDWKNGNDKQIKNWKSSLLNTLPYIKDGQNSNIDKPLKMVY